MALNAPEATRQEPESNAKTPVLNAADPRERRARPAATESAPPPREAPATPAAQAATTPAEPARTEPATEPIPEPTAEPAASQAPAPAPESTRAQPAPADPAPPAQPAPVARAPERAETPAPPPEPPAAPDVSGLDLMDSIAAVAKLEARIGRQLDEYSKRPRKVHIGTRAKEYRFAQYAEDWRQKVERIGTLNYPDDARGRIYGSLVMTVEIRADGTLERVEIDRSSGHDVLDRAAAQIVRMAAPYAPFPPDIRDDTDRVVITRTWTFTNSDQLHTR
ncbi:energy transducer TonB [Pseudazoarcus pumilus]|uniref:Energy transducer TonB n=2 Tax=Pseudazoarcus pumilus TaxID=2067960 RepID=A0A2I6SAN7_9RHOO|nr:energy transducer TonB [Pseudazoarcus pumilus]